MPDRRTFLKLGALGSLFSTGLLKACAPGSTPEPAAGKASAAPPVVISTWEHGLPANEAAWQILDGGGRALDAVEAGVRVTESDPDSRSVGYGGRPDRSGHVTLDASIMDENGDCGAVAFLEHMT